MDPASRPAVGHPAACGQPIPGTLRAQAARSDGHPALAVGGLVGGVEHPEQLEGVVDRHGDVAGLVARKEVLDEVAEGGEPIVDKLAAEDPEWTAALRRTIGSFFPSLIATSSNSRGSVSR